MKRFNKIIIVTTLLLFASLLTLGAAHKYPKDTPIEALDGKNIAVQTAVLYEELIKDKVPHTSFQYYTMPNDMIYALQSGKVDAYLIEGVSYGKEKPSRT